MSPVVETSPEPTVTSDVTGGARLIVHLKENQLQYMIGLLAFHVLGFTQPVVDYGVGICG